MSRVVVVASPSPTASGTSTSSRRTPTPGTTGPWRKRAGAFIADLKNIMALNGADKPLWVTEQAWWSNGQLNLFSQADSSARAQMLFREWGISGWAYFLAQGTWGNVGLSFSAIQGNDFVKPTASRS